MLSKEMPEILAQMGNSKGASKKMEGLFGEPLT